MNLDYRTIRDLIELTDEHGVLSIYAGHTPAQAADPQPTAPIAIRNEIRALKADLAERDKELARAVERRLEDIGDEIDRLVDPKEHGRGRALFVGVTSGTRTRVALQIPFEERVVHHRHAFVRPLVAAYDEGRPAGILVASRAGARLLRWSLGEVTELESYRFEPSGDLAREKTGPTPDQPQHPGHGTPHRERFEERIDEQRHRFLRQVAEEVDQVRKQQGWDRLLLSATPKLRDEAAELLGENGYRLLTTEQTWEDFAPHEIAEEASALLRSVHRERERELVEEAVARGRGGHAGAVGLRNVCEALNEGRVSRLLFRADLDVEGVVSDQGTVHPRVEGYAAAAEAEFTREPMLVERMIEQAVSTDADVTPVEPDLAGELDEHDGVAALLRW